MLLLKSGSFSGEGAVSVSAYNSREPLAGELGRMPQYRRRNCNTQCLPLVEPRDRALRKDLPTKKHQNILLELVEW